MYFVALLPLAVLPFSLARDYPVAVGENGNTFEPKSINAAEGDRIVFTFYPRNHSVAESNFGDPCEQRDDGIFSGYYPVERGTADEIFTVTLNDTNPHWLYCSYGRHCQDGMVMVINPGDGDDNLESYEEASRQFDGTVTDAAVVRGGVRDNASSNNASTTASSTSPASGTTSATSTATGTDRASSSTSGSPAATPSAAAGKINVGAGLGAMGLLGVLVGGMI